jgi:SPX domain protein involved in polyphosphate accumulation
MSEKYFQWEISSSVPLHQHKFFIDFFALDRLIASSPNESFQSSIDTEIEKINIYAVLKYRFLYKSLYCNNSIDLDSLSEDLLGLKYFIDTNFHGLIALVTNSDQVHNQNSLMWFCTRLKRENFMLIDFNELLLLLSEKYSKRRDFGGIREEWQPPSSFVRNTAKYWVKNENVLKLKIILLKKIPFLMYGNSSNHRQLITSVYFDNEASELYTDRLLRNEGSKLVRVRWYGLNNGASDKELFIERKIHHESYTSEASRKDRFIMMQGRIKDFLDLKWKPNGKCSEESDLIDEVSDLLSKSQLKPMVRSCYLRSAFQSSKSNAVRISLDENLTFINEQNTGKQEISSGKISNWCRSDTDALTMDEIIKFPYSILEVKLQNSQTPGFIEEILEACGCVRVHKFSKFIHGMAFLHSTELQPHWMGHFRIEGPGEGQKEEMEVVVPEIEMALIEPKTLFANERTFLHYTLRGLYILLFIQFLMESKRIPRYSEIMKIGCFLYFCWCCTSFVIRQRKILSRKTKSSESGLVLNRLDLRNSPQIFTFLLVSTVILVLFNKVI